MRRLRLKISSIALAGTIVLSLAGMAESGAAQAKAIVQQVAAGQLLAQDTFQRANQTYWGTASDGQRWGGDANSQTAFSIAGNAGYLTNLGTSDSAVLGPVATDAEVLFTGATSTFASNNLGSVLRWQDANDWYKAYVDGSNLVLQADIRGSKTILAQTSFPASANVSYSLRFRAVGPTLSAKAWAASGAEPGAWLVTASDSTLTQGQSGLRLNVLVGSSASITSFQASMVGAFAVPAPSATSTISVPPTSTVAVPPTSTVAVPPTSTVAVPPTSTVAVPPTSTAVPPTSTVAVPPTSTVAVPAPSGIVFGSAISGAGQANGGPAIDAFNSLVYPGGGRVSAVEYFLDLSSGFGTSSPIDNNIYARGATPVLTWQPQGIAGNDQWVANGGYDAALTAFAQAEAADGRVLYIRFGHEMNGQWYPWSPGNNGNTSASYVAMWRHVHDLFVANHATNVRWLWCPNVGQNSFVPDYPGDAYVDYAGLDGYNWGSSQASGWQSFQSIFAADYARMTALTSKPILIGETSSSENGGSKAAWITQALLTDLPQSFPQIKGLLWFNENKEQDWRVNSSPTALAAMQQAAASPLYQGRLS